MPVFMLSSRTGLGAHYHTGVSLQQSLPFPCFRSDNRRQCESNRPRRRFPVHARSPSPTPPDLLAPFRLDVTQPLLRRAVAVRPASPSLLPPSRGGTSRCARGALQMLRASQISSGEEPRRDCRCRGEIAL